jgi:phenylalanine-4-hydroxylase
MQAERDAALAAVDTKTTTANSAIKRASNERAIVELDPDHPGFRDPDYRERRNHIAQIAIDYTPDSPIPDAPYTEEEHEVWRIVNRELDGAHESFACKEYLECKRILALPKDQIPQLSAVSERVQKISGFRLEPVGGLVLPRVFLETLGNGVFLSTQYIRHYSTPLYTPEPDVVHETLGHATMLANEQIAEITRLVGDAVRRSDEEGLERISKIYWFTIEFGVIREDGLPKAYGAGLLSSAGELAALKTTEMRPFDLEAMSRQEYDVTMFQPFLFCADSFEDMYRTMKDYLQR